MPQALAGKTAVITGANRGIGFAIARLFACEGARCALLVRDESAGRSAAEKIGGVARAPIVATADVSDEASVARAAERVAREFDALDLLVNNAGVLLDEDRRANAAGMKPETLRKTLAVNLYGPVHVCNAFQRLLRHDSRIINVSSTMGQLSDGSAGYAPAYCISKTALNAYTQALADALGSRGVMVDCFHPGWAKTAMGGPNASVDPDDAAQVALFLATRPHSDDTGKFWRHNGVIDW